MDRKERVLQLLTEEFSLDGKPPQIEIEDESRLHSRGGAETHFKILLVSERFRGQSRIIRQRQVQQLLAQEFETGLHALSLRCLCPEEAADAGLFRSPSCVNSDQPK